MADTIASAEIMRYHAPAGAFVEALPLGNGHLGAMVYGQPGAERISLNHDTLWSGIPEGNRPRRPGGLESRTRAASLVKEGRYLEADRELGQHFLGRNAEKYLPLGDLLLTFPEGEITDYARTLDLSRAVSTVSFRRDGRRVTRELFCSHPHDVLAVRLCAEGLAFTLAFRTPLKGGTIAEGDTIVCDGAAPGLSHAENVNDNDGWYAYPDEPEKSGVRFRAAARVLTDGTVTDADGTLTVTGASEAVVLFTAATSFVSFDVPPGTTGDGFKARAVDTLAAAADAGWDALLTAHTDDYRDLYTRVTLDLGETEGRGAMTTDARMDAFAQDGNDPSLRTLYFNYGKYLTISASRKGDAAMNLQGIWNDSMTPPWRCNYTINMNTQMNYFPTLMLGLAECQEPLTRLVQAVAANGRRIAAEDYGARGWTCHHNSDLWGHAGAVWWEARWGFFCGASGWLCRHLYDEWRYTRDETFLRETLYPIIGGAARFYMDILSDLGDGTLAVVPGTSPENGFFTDVKEPDGTASRGIACVARYTTIQNAIAAETIGEALDCARALGISDDFTAEAEDKLSRILPPQIGPDGRLMEWNEPFDEPEPTHRHVAHLYGLHPGHTISPEKTPALAEAARKTLAVRGDGGSGWALAWKMNFYARLNDGDHALLFLDKMLERLPSTLQGGEHGGSYLNLFDAHPPFQIDGNFGAVSGILEMLVRSDGDDLYLLPALPAKWPDGSLTGVRVPGGQLDLVWKDGVLTSWRLTSALPLTVWYRGEKLSV